MNKTDFTCDLLVIGSGPAGIHAAIQASKMGKSVIIVEKHPSKLGGTWIHTGTLPSKTLREAVANIQDLKHFIGEEWVKRIIHELSFDNLRERAESVVNAEEEVLKKHLTANSVKIIQGHAQFQTPHILLVDRTLGAPVRIHGNHILIGTGSRPRRPDFVDFDGWRVVDSDELLRLKNLPKSMIIYGAGVIGCEYACIFSALGVETMVMDARRSIMQSVDLDIAEALKKAMEQLGVTFTLGHNLVSASAKQSKALIQSNKDQQAYEYQSDVFFFAAGRSPNSDGLALDAIGMGVNERGTISVNKNFQTNHPHIYAVGDVIGSPALAATSAEQGRFACCHAFGVQNRSFPQQYPIGVYTIPELSSVGKTEEELKAAQTPYVVGVASFEEVARGHIRGDHNGILKLLAHAQTEEILGIHVIGADACNLVHIGVALMVNQGKLHDLVDRMIFNYPTLAEAYRVAAFNAINKLRMAAESNQTAA